MNRKKVTGRELNIIWDVHAKHALYREDGKWYHHLKEFPGALFDVCGYIVFNDEEKYINCEYLQHGNDLHVPKGISAIPGYTKVIE